MKLNHARARAIGLTAAAVLTVGVVNATSIQHAPPGRSGSTALDAAVLTPQDAHADELPPARRAAPHPGRASSSPRASRDRAVGGASPAPARRHHRVATPAPRARRLNEGSGSTSQQDLTSSGIHFTYTELRIRSCESGPNGYATHGKALDYNYAEDDNSASTASGGWQVLDSTWAGYGGYSRAVYAPRAVQDRWAREALDKSGTTPWNASRSCWGHG